MRIKTQLLLSFALMFLLLAGVAGVSIERMGQIGRIAGDLNGRVVDKTRIAANITDLEQQIRFVDSFLLKASDPDQDQLARDLIESRNKAVDSQIFSYMRFVDSPLERSLLQNLERSRSVYSRLQQDILGTAAEGRHRQVADDEARLANAFDQVKRQTKGLALVAETEARAARQDAIVIAQGAGRTVLVVAGIAMATGVIMMGVLLTGVFRPMAHITEALIALSQGRLNVVLPPSGRNREIDRMTQALDIYRNNAVALAKAHEETKAAHSRADALARHDVLTGLPNRRVLASAVNDIIKRSARRSLAAAVLVLDLDRFKPVNDIHGHSAGDKVLCEVATRLGAILRVGDVAARLGGDEFAIILEFEPGSDTPHRVAKRILACINAPILLDGRSVSVGTSIGIAVSPTDGDDAETLLHAADLAMFKAKREGRGSFRFFEAEMDVQLRARADLEARICHAILKGDIRPHYQPLVDLRTDTIVGFEVLARWHDGELLRSPDEFIQIADEAGLMPQLTYSVLRQACRDSLAWPNTLTLAVNVTPAQISDPGLPGALFEILQQEKFPPSRLELEITENALIGDIASAKNVMAILRQHGVRISLDDFGTGYSSLHHLRELKFDKIKIDRSFVQSMPTNAESMKIVETILALGRSLGIDTLAEGVEDVGHLRHLVDQGCEFGQGYHFGKPLPAGAASDLLTKQNPPALLTSAA
ncbi:EAL domain-containing protein [Lichenifustis flavocetrariae]|uniref:EAL domain-containing protein n=1 Tax=Lichenifustis flavocetrariae TaxID=2949735 RepID=A0AA41Z1U3_9HYPH|nr:EAL domain-containing protein [Lichenifustis flavocetrariae]MCW6511437.1 EAL domain-containing protein [Lichenifustis flavocetrariae]